MGRYRLDRGSALVDARQAEDSGMKRCAHEPCNKEMKRRQTESRLMFEERKFCSHACSVAYRKAWMWKDRRAKRSAIKIKIPAPTEEEWLRLNGGPTMCPAMYAAPVCHHLQPSFTRRNGSVR